MVVDRRSSGRLDGTSGDRWTIFRGRGLMLCIANTSLTVVNWIAGRENMTRRRRRYVMSDTNLESLCFPFSFWGTYQISVLCFRSVDAS